MKTTKKGAQGAPPASGSKREGREYQRKYESGPKRRRMLEAIQRGLSLSVRKLGERFGLAKSTVHDCLKAAAWARGVWLANRRECQALTARARRSLREKVLELTEVVLDGIPVKSWVDPTVVEDRSWWGGWVKFRPGRLLKPRRAKGVTL
jgi:hypothetical protein